MIIFGIDPGYDRLGWAVAQLLPRSQVNLLSYGLITTDKKLPLLERYRQLDQELTTLLQEFSPDHAAIETLFFFKNQKTVMQVAEARGLIISALLRHNAQIYQYTPKQIKAAVAGDGAADKKAVEKLVRLQLSLPENAQVLDDTYDALAALLTHAALASSPQLKSN